MIFKNLFSSKKEETSSIPVTTDVHSHLLPGLDDGVETFEEALELVVAFKELGYNKLITTPHVMGDFFKNTPEGIINKKKELEAYLNEKGIEMQIEAAAEYYLDEWFMEKVEAGDLLTFGKNYVLIETSYINEPGQLHEVIFELRAKGYIPVLAHPERYTYMYGAFEKYQDLIDKGALFQLNTISLSGYYSKRAKQIAEKLIEEKMIHFLGSDCHGTRHIEALKKTTKEKTYKKALSLNLLNHSL